MTDPNTYPAGVPRPSAEQRSVWSGGRVVAVVLGSLVALLGLGLAVAGGGALWYDQARRDDDGFLSTDTARFSTSSYAIRSEEIDVQGVTDMWADVVGTFRLTARSSDDTPVFVGIGRASDVETYLGGVDHDVVVDLGGPDITDVGLHPTYRHEAGDEPVPPTDVDIWSASISGTGELNLDWSPESGGWEIVVMNADGSREVAADLTASADLPNLGGFAIAVLVGGIILLVIGMVIIVIAVQRSAAAAR